MDNNFIAKQIGIICTDKNGFRIELAPEYREALIGLDGFSVTLIGNPNLTSNK